MKRLASGGESGGVTALRTRQPSGINQKNVRTSEREKAGKIKRGQDEGGQKKK